MKENQHIEYKEVWRDEYLKWICAFANADGGVLHIGRTDKGAVIGLASAKKLLEEIPNKVRDILGIMVKVNLREEAGKECLEIIVDPYPYPVSYRGEYHYRSGSTKQELKGAALDRFLLKKQGRHWDGVPIPNFSMADLSQPALAAFKKKAAKSERLSAELLAESDAILLDRLRLFDHTYLKRAAVMLFHDDPERVVTGAYIKIGYFRTDSDLLYQDEIHGNLFNQVEKTLDLLLTKYLRAGISYEGIQRLETFPVPESALREALINAIAHKDYAAGIPVQISVYHNKLMIWNPGHLPQDWTIERLSAKHASSPYNPDIANAFFRAAFMESWGRGIDLIRNACRAAGNPAPAFRWDNGLWVEFALQEVRTPVKTLGKTLGKTPGKTTDLILGLLQKNPSLTVPEIALQISKSESAVQRGVLKLQIARQLKRTGSRKSGHWEVLKGDE
ncbi:MAG: ATP-dependent DNA helicase RecG [Elusimicrobia bacterium]|nr:MAG: ATP-dependent DNA helicase RecG [Elusimicrobiota bacterium]KAF0158011.1 MAG: ATP-dependent DNA helicase RecG [Elusimicrobiota bacterium]